MDWRQSKGFRWAALTVSGSNKPGFTLLGSESTGIQFTNTLSDINASQNQIRLNGSGVALGDVDGDGLCDIFVCSLEATVALYRNLGQWRFTNITSAAGLSFPGNDSTGATFADVDGDGDLDLLLNGIGTGTRLFLNDGSGHFTESTNSGLTRRFGAMTCALADIDGDGTLDLYVANYRTNTVRTTGFSLLNVDGKRMIMPRDRGRLEITASGRVLEHGDPDFLYVNDGHGKFTARSWGAVFQDEDGRIIPSAPPDWGLTAAFRDINGDGAPDLYVCNDFHSPDRIWMNDGHGHFRAIPRLAIRHTATFSMAVDFADIDRDGRDDILVSDMTSRLHGRRLMQIAGMDPYDINIGVFDDRPQLDRTVLQWNRGDGTYAEIAHYAGLENSEWNWSVIFLDVDLDGYEDVLASTGHMFDTQDLDAQAQIQARGPFPPAMVPKKLLMLPPLREPKLAFRNMRDLTFQECGELWGFNQVGVSHGMALADLDNDGDLDLVVNNLNAALGVYRNDASQPRIAVRLKAPPPNTRGVGARIKVTGGPVSQTQEMMCGGRYLSSDDMVRVFACGTTSNDLQIEVSWPGGKRSVVLDAQPNRIYEIDESAASASEASPLANSTPTPLFKDISEKLAHRHLEDPFDDFQRQPLLPRRLSQPGPAVGWWDINGDGWDDLVIGSGKGGHLAYFQNDGKGGLQAASTAPWNTPATRDQAGIVGWGKTAVLVASANYEDGAANGSAVLLYESGKPQPLEVVPAWDSSAGPLAVADYDGDGNLDLFVGGRVKPGQYPAAASSRLYRQRQGKLELDIENSRRFTEVGLVSGAVWSDLDADGWPELILACEWGPIRIFHNAHGRLDPIELPVSSPLGPEAMNLSQLTGLWNSVTTGDLDGDGLPDIIACNLGRNTKYRASVAAPMRVYFGDFNHDGSVTPIESCYDEKGREVPDRDLLVVSASLPWVREKFPTHAAFARATIPDLLGDGFKSAGKLQVVTLDSMVLLNRTNKLLAVPLPPEAQFAPALGASAGDLNGDGCEDVFLIQNLFATEAKTPRCDAGRGLMLAGDGHGGLNPVPSQESGIKVYGEQRGAALGDFNQDGRVDLVVTQNGAETRLFSNERARPGLRVRLNGPPGNPNGIGAMVRLCYGSGTGPAREIRSGSGYWSQDSPVQVLGCSQVPTQIEIRWPGGRRSVRDVPAGAREIVVDFSGR